MYAAQKLSPSNIGKATLNLSRNLDETLVGVVKQIENKDLQSDQVILERSENLFKDLFLVLPRGNANSHSLSSP